MVGRDVLKREGLWTIGTGDRIRVFSDPWLSSKPGFRVDGHFQGDPTQEPRVSNLINSVGGWDTATVRQWVTPEDADIIT